MWLYLQMVSHMLNMNSGKLLEVPLIALIIKAAFT